MLTTARRRSVVAAIVGLAATALALGGGFFDRSEPEDARAQSETDGTQPNALADDGAVSNSGEPTEAVTSEPALAGTPVPGGAPAATTVAGIIEGAGAVTASLGGSDIAVTSEGGSYEVDGPKRRANRTPKVAPRP